eukprot:symbB.v1.2.028037.t1/scaffold2927.1/size67078/4
MVQPESNPLEALQSWVSWANSGSALNLQGLQDGLVPGLPGVDSHIETTVISMERFAFAGFGRDGNFLTASLTSRLPAEAEAVDWEADLKRQNAANDELCSENAALQIEVQRLAAADVESEEEVEDQDCWLDELISKVQNAASEIAQSRQSTGDADAFLDGLLTKLLPCLEQAIRAAHADEGSGATMAEEVALLVSEKMALREQVERQQEQIEMLEDQLQEMSSVSS